KEKTPSATPNPTEMAAQLKELDQRVSATEREQSLDRVNITGDYRFEAHTIGAKIPAHHDGLSLHNLLVKPMFVTHFLGRPPQNVTEINNPVAAHWADYQQYLGGVTFDKLKQGMAQFPAAMQQQLMGMLMPSTFTSSYKDNTDALFTN